MANGVKDFRSLPLFEIIGAPLVAVVQAEAQATRATVEYIQQIGFLPREPKDGEQQEFGNLRMAQFRYVKPDENGNPSEFLAQVPILSLVPIPGIRVKSAKLAFTAKISDAFSETAASTTRAAAAAAPQALWLKPAITQFRGSLAPSSGTGSDKARGSYELKIQIELEQMPIAPGLEKLLQTMDQAISDDKNDSQRG